MKSVLIKTLDAENEVYAPMTDSTPELLEVALKGLAARMLPGGCFSRKGGTQPPSAAARE